MRRRGVLVSVVAAVGLACAACGGSPETAPAAPPAPALTADQVGPAVVAAGNSASAVHVKATVDQGPTAIQVDVQVNKDSADGTMVTDGMTVPIRRVGWTYYAQLTDTVIKQTHGSRAMLNKWVTSESKFASELALAGEVFLDYNGFVAKATGQVNAGSPTAAGSGTVDGVPVLVFHLSDGYTADVAAAAPHYLVRLSQGADEMHFSGWGQPVPVEAPPASAIYSGGA